MNKDIEKIYYQQKYQPFYNNLNNYLKTYIIPEVIAFYLASSFEYNCLDNHHLENHINSALDLFNVNININDIFPIIKKLLIIKYNLQIVNDNPLILKKEH